MSNTPPAIATPKANPRLIFENLMMALATDTAADMPPPVKHAPPKLPPGVVPSGATFALDNAGVSGDMYQWLNSNVYCGMGFPGYTYLAELQQRSEYRAPVETIANEMTRKWIQFKGADEKRLKELTTAFEEFAVREKFRLAAVHDGGQGRGMLYIDIKGYDSPERRKLPLKITPETVKVGSLVGFQNIEPMWSTPYAYNSTDPTKPDFYRPVAWYIMGQETHADRLLTFVGRPVPDILKPSYNFGGLSLTQLVQPYVVRWLKTVDSVNRLLSNFSLTYLKTDMEGTLAGTAGANEALVNRLRVFAAVKDNRGVAAIDKDSEEFEQINTPLSGLSELQAQAQEHMAAPTHIPLVFLTGITPSGLNASSEGEIKVFYNWIAGEQENFFEGNLRVVFELIQLHLWGKVDDTISFEWVALDAPTTKELGEIRKADADAGVAYVGAGVISPDEERERLRNDPDSGYTSLTGKAPTPTLEDEAALGEAGKQLDHERSQEDAKTAHERAKEMARIDAQNKPKPAQDSAGLWRKLLRRIGLDGWEESKHPRGPGGKFGTGSQSDPDEPDTVTPMEPEYEMSPEYKAANEAFNTAAREFAKAQTAYRAKEIGDKEFLAARAKMKQAEAEFDVAFTNEQNRDHEGEARAKAEAAHASELSKQGGLF